MRTIDALIATWRADIAAEALGPSSNATDVSLRSSRTSGATLRRRVWDPLTAHVAGASRIFVVTDGSLNLVPFVALPVGQRSYVWIIARLSTTCPPSGTSCFHRQLRIPAAAFWPLEVHRSTMHHCSADIRRNRSPPRLAKPGGSAPRRRPTLRRLQAARFPALIGTRQEVNELSGLWDTGAKPTAGFGNTRVLIGREASETTFKEEAHHYRVLHLATHGFFSRLPSEVQTALAASEACRRRARRARAAGTPLKAPCSFPVSRSPVQTGGR